MPRAAAEFVLCVALAVLPASRSPAQAPSPSNPSPESQKLAVVVSDENGIAVSGVRVLLNRAQPADAPSNGEERNHPASVIPLRCETDFAGRCEFIGFPAGIYEVRAEKTGFYASVLRNVQTGAVPEVDITLARTREVREVVDVAESPFSIDLSQIASKEELTGAEMIDIPYPGPHDYHNALNFIPGVTPDSFGQLHVAGAEGYQTLVLLDGFNVSQPTNGQLALRTSIESFRSIEVASSREPAEFGKGSGGVLRMNTAMGSDRYRLTATDFLPGISDMKGRFSGSWTPIATISGPLIKGRLWFIDALDGEFDDNVNPQLPAGRDRDYVWRADNLAKMQANVSSRNIVTASFLSNYYRDEYAGLGFLVPQAATPIQVETAYFGSLKDQYYFRSGALLETGIGVDQYNTTLTPRGDAPYVELFFSAAGNYYLHEDAQARRVQGLWNLYLPPHQWRGRHDIKFGADLDRLSYDAEFLRQPISYEQQGSPAPGQNEQPCPIDANGVPAPPYICSRYSVFSGGTYAPLDNTEASAYVEDRWLVTNRLLIEPGVRFDWDELVRTPLFSPRLAGTFRLDAEGTTKISAGVGLVYDATNLGLIHQPLEGERTDYFFKCVQTSPSGSCIEGEPTDASGNVTPEPVPVPTTFVVERNSLQAPRYLNSSASLEKRLPYAVFLKLEFLAKRGSRAFAYNTLNGASDGIYLLGNGRDDHYDSFTVSLRHAFHGHYEVFGAYTRSVSRSNQIFDFSLDIPVLSPQLAGPFGWDTPNRFVGWGVLPGFKLPVIHKFDIVYSAEARNGLPFYGTTDQGQIAPGYAPSSSLRFPAYYTLNLQVEKRIHLFARYWELRAGFNDITNHPDIAGANTTIDSTHPFPTFIDGTGRAFAFRIRLLGRS
jgi:hypothetical protein